MPDITDVLGDIGDVVDDVLPVVSGFADGFDLSDVLPLVLEKIGMPAALEVVLFDVLAGDKRADLRKAFKRSIQRRITAQEGRSGAELLARAIIKQIDFHYEVEAKGLTMDERHQIVNTLIQNSARQFLIAADILLSYGVAARDVNAAKQTANVRGLVDARLRRTLMVNEFRDTMVNTVRAIVGDDVVT